MPYIIEVDAGYGKEYYKARKNGDHHVTNNKRVATRYSVKSFAELQVNAIMMVLPKYSYKVLEVSE